MGGLLERGGLFHLETTMVSVLHKELEYKVIKISGTKNLGVMQPRIRIKSEHPVGEYTIPEQSARSFAVVVD